MFRIEMLRAAQGDALWITFGRGAVMVPADGNLPAVDLHGPKLTVVPPGLEQLLDLKDYWDEAGFEPGDIAAALAKLSARRDLAPPDVLGTEDTVEEGEYDEASDGVGFDDQLGEASADFGSDQSPANGSRIAVLAASLRRWPAGKAARGHGDTGTGDLELFELPHHGSVANVLAELLGLIPCRGYLVSTSGTIFGHLHDRAIELVIGKHRARGRPQLFFNYRAGRNVRWDDPRARAHDAHFPSGIAVEAPER